METLLRCLQLNFAKVLKTTVLPTSDNSWNLKRISERIWSEFETNLKRMWNEFEGSLKRIQSQHASWREF